MKRVGWKRGGWGVVHQAFALDSGLILATGPMRSLKPIQALTNDKTELHPLARSTLPLLSHVAFIRSWAATAIVCPVEDLALT